MSWSDDDNLVAYYLYRFGDRDLNVTKQELGDILGMGYDSLSFKISNFRAIDGQGKLNGYSVQAVRIYKHYNALPEEQAKAAGQGAILRAMEKHVDGLKVKMAHQKP